MSSSSVATLLGRLPAAAWPQACASVTRHGSTDRRSGPASLTALDHAHEPVPAAASDSRLCGVRRRTLLGCERYACFHRPFGLPVAEDVAPSRRSPRPLALRRARLRRSSSTRLEPSRSMPPLTPRPRLAVWPRHRDMSDPVARAQASFDRPAHAEGASHASHVAARRHTSARSRSRPTRCTITRWSSQAVWLMSEPHV